MRPVTNEEMIRKAASVVRARKHGDAIVGDVGCALVSDKNNLYLGVCIDTRSGMQRQRHTLPDDLRLNRKVNVGCRRRTKEEWKWAVEGLQAVVRRAEHLGVTLCLEPLNRFETYFLNTLQDASQLIHEIGTPNIRIHVDTFHGNIEEKKPATRTKVPDYFYLVQLPTVPSNMHICRLSCVMSAYHQSSRFRKVGITDGEIKRSEVDCDHVEGCCIGLPTLHEAFPAVASPS